MVNNQKFRCLVEADAKAVIDRQETDSIEIIDEIRYVLRTCNLTTSSMEMGSMVRCIIAYTSMAPHCKLHILNSSYAWSILS